MEGSIQTSKDAAISAITFVAFSHFDSLVCWLPRTNSNMICVCLVTLSACGDSVIDIKNIVWGVWL